jgi:hypothetical protein
MDRNWESVRNDALALEPSRQALLVEEMVDQLSHTPHMQAWLMNRNAGSTYTIAAK